MKEIDELIEKYKKVFLVNELEVIQDLEQLKEQLKEQHSPEKIKRELFIGKCSDAFGYSNVLNILKECQEPFKQIDSNYQQTHE